VPMYIRIKSKKCKKGQLDYAYQVLAYRSTKGPRQKIICYLGRIFYPGRNNLHITEFLYGKNLEDYFKDKSLSETVNVLLEYELTRHGFKADKGIFTKDSIIVDLSSNNVIHDGKNVVLGINQGFMCSKTIQQIKKLIYSKSNIKNIIKSIILVGIILDEDLFTTIFRGKF